MKRFQVEAREITAPARKKSVMRGYHVPRSCMTPSLAPAHQVCHTWPVLARTIFALTRPLPGRSEPHLTPPYKWLALPYPTSPLPLRHCYLTLTLILRHRYLTVTPPFPQLKVQPQIICSLDDYDSLTGNRSLCLPSGHLDLEVSRSVRHACVRQMRVAAHHEHVAKGFETFAPHARRLP